MDRAKEGTLRLLTLEEIALARSIFGGSIDYARVWIHCDSYLPFGLQSRDTAMSPNGEIWFRKELYSDNFAKEADVRDRHLFIHEMMHVWQHQKHMWVRMRGLFSWAADYSYQLDGKPLLSYSLEQQAQIVADYYVLYTYGYKEWDTQRRRSTPLVTLRGAFNRDNLISVYQKTIFSNSSKDCQ
ncbi:type IV secretion protein Rhs [Mixta hanseatica]|uniref:Type IV secretion protein Rhs n=1 Tax=Mixta hanseatica TaxID=2872648 RepID=A0ABY4R5L6_9GAMM|nr:type IV secretion protein Rhs [Mixta hanseatica]UQY42677.1 type IV secretion protein Rhs [Mixta hanseatica]